MSRSSLQGQAAEQLACQYLEAQGLRLLTRNYRWRGGEIDLICRDASHLVFIEVRYRRSQQFGGALASVTWQKQQRIVRTAQHYLLYHPDDLPVRFDVIAINGTVQAENLQWIQHAFEVS